VSSTGIEVGVTNKCSGDLRPEFVRAREIGYLGDFPQIKLAVDVRVFNEQLSGMIFQGSSPSGIKSYSNVDQFALDGLRVPGQVAPLGGWPAAAESDFFAQRFFQRGHSDVGGGPVQLAGVFSKAAAQLGVQSDAQRQRPPGACRKQVRRCGTLTVKDQCAFRDAHAAGLKTWRMRSYRPKHRLPYADYESKRVSFQQRAFFSLSLDM